jgi:hypothetical protein
MKCEVLKAELTQEQKSNIPDKCKGMINKQGQLIAPEMQPLCCLVCESMQKKTVFIVTGIWRGVLDKVKVFKTLETAENFKKTQLKDYDIDADKWDDEDRENMDYDVSITEEELN